MKIESVSEADGQIAKNRRANKKSHKIWVQTLNPKRDDIIDTIKKTQARIQDSTSRLTEEENFQGSLPNENQANLKANAENSLKNSYITDRVQYNLKEAKKIMNEIKKKNDEILKMNAYYVLNHGKKYLKMENDNNKDESDHVNLPKIDLQKDNVHKNFRYINDSYRTELMRAFLNYNPIIHLNNLTNLLEKADPAIKEDITNLRKRIEEDLKEINDPHYYLHQYQKVMKRREQHGSITQPIEKKSSVIKAKSGGLSIEKKKDMYKKQKDKPELEMMRDCLAKIDAAIDSKNIKRYIGDCDAVMGMPYEEKMTNYFPQFKRAEDILKNLHVVRMNLATEEQTKNSKSSAMRNNEEMLKFIKDSKNNLLASILDNEKKLYLTSG